MANAKRHLFAALAVALAMAPATSAENLIDNSDFDLNTLGWEYAFDGSLADWVTIDHDACGNDSGSALAENSEPGAPSFIYYRTCALGIVAGGEYTLDGFLRFPPSQSRSGAAFIRIVWKDSADDCNGGSAGTTETSDLPSTNDDVWIHKALRNLIAPAGAASAEIRVVLTKNEAGGTLVANFDGVHLVDANDYLFGDGFEGDTICRWDVRVP